MKQIRTTVAYGASGLGKTSQIDPLAIYIANKYNKPTLLVTSDGGGSDVLEDVKSAGLVQGFDLASVSDPMPTLRDIFQGKHKTIKLDRFGAIAWEGITTTASLCLRNQTSKGRKVSQDPVGLFEEGGRKFAASPPSLYGLIQNFIFDVLSIDMRFLPDNIKHVYITAHESKGVDVDNSTIYGPAAVGKAATALIPPQVGDLFHFDTIQVDTKNESKSKSKPSLIQPVAWFLRHPDPKTGVEWVAKPRIAPSALHLLMEKWPNGYIPLTISEDGEYNSSIVSYFEFLDSLSSQRANVLKELIKN